MNNANVVSRHLYKRTVMIDTRSYVGHLMDQITGLFLSVDSQ